MFPDHFLKEKKKTIKINTRAAEELCHPQKALKVPGAAGCELLSSSPALSLPLKCAWKPCIGESINNVRGSAVFKGN